ncbi:unnamed protein product [Pleuronectes platessa]|uniref:Uncharacterized protein n=1 Tax=Pleuronectes platessa TaxID=8262 RepID=A0A9N7UXX3_PLEPL|nr:unnamed protein product [Pleuronectes platessa]
MFIHSAEFLANGLLVDKRCRRTSGYYHKKTEYGIEEEIYPGKLRLHGPYLQVRTRFLNRGKGTQQCVQKSQHINHDQDPDQEVVTTTKTEGSIPHSQTPEAHLLMGICMQDP